MRVLIVALPLLALAACATAPGGSRLANAEIGYAPGSLGYAAIEAGDWATAEAQLTASRAGDDDPARLLNLAHVYAKTGRLAEAQALYEQVAASRDDGPFELSDGTVISAREAARRALARVRTTTALR